MVENRKHVEKLVHAFEELAKHAHQNRYDPAVVADCAFRASLSLMMEQHGVRGVAEQCRRLSVEFGQFADAIDAAG